MFNLSSDWKKIGQSGPTVDGRMIAEESIKQMAEYYDEAVYTALLWADHERWDWYNNKAAPNYGKVSKLKVVDNADGGVDLYAIIKPNENYIYENRNGQLLFFSMEITSDFAKKGYAYLTGLGITDNPASLGTSEMRFSTNAKNAGMLFTDYIATATKQFTEEPKQSDSFAELFKHFFSQKPPAKDNDMTPQELAAAIEAGNKSLLAGIADIFRSQKTETPPDKKPEAEGDDKPLTKAELFALAKDIKEGKFSLDDEKPLTKADALEMLKGLFKKDDDKEADKFTDADKAALKAEIEAGKKRQEELEAKFAAAMGEKPGTDGGADDGAGDDLKDCV